MFTTMHLTNEDYIKIEKWLQSRSIKDTELPFATKVKGNDVIPIIQDSKNKQILVSDLLDIDLLNKAINNINSANVVSMNPVSPADLENPYNFNIHARELWEVHKEENEDGEEEEVYNMIQPITSINNVIDGNGTLKEKLDSILIRLNNLENAE